MTRWVAFLVLASVVFPLAGIVMAVGLALAGGDVGAVITLLLVPALGTLLLAIRMDRPNWAIVVSPVVSGVLGLVAGFAVIAYFTEGPFE
jgi:hypothetical protein